MREPSALLFHYSIAANVMRRVLIDYARKRNAQKRGSGIRVTLKTGMDFAEGRAPDSLLLDEALRKLAEFDQHASSVCLFHVVVAFRDRTTGRRVRFARREARNVILGLEGRGPEFRVDVLGAGFLAAPGGRIRTNPHVVEQWREDQ